MTKRISPPKLTEAQIAIDEAAISANEPLVQQIFKAAEGPFTTPVSAENYIKNLHRRVTNAG